jgi:hypothetical protein
MENSVGYLTIEKPNQFGPFKAGIFLLVIK